MRKATHPYEDRYVDVPAFIKEFGKKVDNDENRARCPICQNKMFIVAASTPNSIGHFSHMPNTGFCPTKSASAAQYSKFLPRNPDSESAKTIRKQFANNWEKHFQQLNWFVKGLSYNEFIDVIKSANKSRVWEYSKLEEHHLPYIFATLTDFPPGKSYTPKGGTPIRGCYFRCWFDATVTRYDDLWIHRTSPLQFWRAWYKLQDGKRKPTIEDLIDAYPVDIESNFLSKESKVPAYIIKKVSTWIDKNFTYD